MSILKNPDPKVYLNGGAQGVGETRSCLRMFLFFFLCEGFLKKSNFLIIKGVGLP